MSATVEVMAMPLWQASAMPLFVCGGCNFGGGGDLPGDAFLWVVVAMIVASILASAAFVALLWLALRAAWRVARRRTSGRGWPVA